MTAACVLLLGVELATTPGVDPSITPGVESGLTPGVKSLFGRDTIGWMGRQHPKLDGAHRSTHRERAEDGAGTVARRVDGLRLRQVHSWGLSNSQPAEHQAPHKHPRRRAAE